MIALLFGIAILAGFVGMGLCIFGIALKLPFTGRERTTYFFLAGSLIGFALLASVLSWVNA